MDAYMHRREGGGHTCIMYLTPVGISLVAETVADSEPPDQQQQTLAEGLQFAYTLPATDIQPHDVSTVHDLI